MLETHFDTYYNGIKPTYKPKPISQGIPYISENQKTGHLALSGSVF